MNVVSMDEIEHAATDVLARLEQNTHLEHELGPAAARARHAYKRAYLRALLKSKGVTVGDREAQAFAACEELHLAKEIAEAKLSACQNEARNLRSQADLVRSLNSNVRALTVGD